MFTLALINLLQSVLYVLLINIYFHPATSSTCQQQNYMIEYTQNWHLLNVDFDVLNAKGIIIWKKKHIKRHICICSMKSPIRSSVWRRCSRRQKKSLLKPMSRKQNKFYVFNKEFHWNSPKQKNFCVHKKFTNKFCKPLAKGTCIRYNTTCVTATKICDEAGGCCCEQVISAEYVRF